MEDVTIEEITSKSAVRDTHPVMKQLRPLDVETYVELVEQMREESGYRLFALFAGDEIRAVAGIVVPTNLYHGKHMWVHDLVVDEPHRGKGYGGQLLSHLTSLADSMDCTCVELASGHWRDRAHEFYENEDMELYCYTFKTDLEAEPPA